MPRVAPVMRTFWPASENKSAIAMLMDVGRDEMWR